MPGCPRAVHELYAKNVFPARALITTAPSDCAVTFYVITDAPLGVELRQVVQHRVEPDAASRGKSSSSSSSSSSSETITSAAAPAAATFASWGTISRPDALLRACATAVDAGADALALVASFPDDEDPKALAAYRAGSGVDAIAGAEALISNLITREIGVPCAHAPALPTLDADPLSRQSPRRRSWATPFCPAVLVGLSGAPHLVPLDFEGTERGFTGYRNGIILTADDVDAVVVPADSFGGAAVMSLAARPDTLVVVVRSNTTTMRVPPHAVGIPPSRVLYAASYAEAAGFLAAHKAGIDSAGLGTDVPRVQRTYSAGKYGNRPHGHLETQMLIGHDA
jgi:hypothetical protein